MAGRTWRDLQRQRGQAAPGAPPRASAPAPPPRPDPDAILGELPQLGRLLEQRQQLENRMSTLTGGSGPHDQARFPVTPLPQRRAEYRQWESAREERREQQPGAEEVPRPVPGESPRARLARWFAERDEQVDHARGQSRDRRNMQQSVMNRLDRRNLRAREQAADQDDRPDDDPSLTPRERRERFDRAFASDARERMADSFNRPDQTPDDTDLEGRPRRRPGDPVGEQLDHRPRRRPGDADAHRLDARPRQGARDEDGERLDRRPRTARDNDDDARLDQRLERARERLIGRDSDVQRATRKADDFGRQLGDMSGQLKSKMADADRKMAAEGLDSGREELRKSPVNKITEKLDKGADILRRPQKMVDRANAEWEKRRDQISGILPVDRSFKDRTAKLLGVETGSIEDFEERMNRVRDRALRRRDAASEQERRDEQRRERARQRAAERKREEERGR